MTVQKDIEITREMKLRVCTCGRCCNAKLIKKMYDTLDKIANHPHCKCTGEDTYDCLACMARKTIGEIDEHSN